ncbi:MAG TPA: SatD family protein, partial [Candidatus Acidoferrales bacterium]
MMKKRHAVLLADIVESSKKRNLRATLGKRVELAAREHRAKRWIELPYAITAGDEFQAILGKGASIPEMIFDLRVKFWPLRLRIGIGVGRLTEKIQRPVNRMGGEAFQRARRAIESIKEEHPKYEVLTAFRTGNENFDATANLIYAL